MRTITFDIETGPLPPAKLAQFEPVFEAPSNYKDPAKIAAIQAEKRQEWETRAALDALTGQILAIGTLEAGKVRIFGEDDERGTITAFLTWATASGSETPRLIGFNCISFDLSYLHRRALLYGITYVRNLWTARRPFDHCVTDLRDLWQCGDRQAHGSLDTIAKHLGLGSKDGEVQAKDFHRYWHEDRAKAIAYLENDLRLTAAIAQRMGVEL
jgi:DNA polymerase elongation subunit (family B)